MLCCWIVRPEEGLLGCGAHDTGVEMEAFVHMGTANSERHESPK